MQVGNPLLEFNTDFNSRTDYLWSHGLISDATYELSQKICNVSQIQRQSLKGLLSSPCALVNSHMSNEIGKFIDFYDVTLDVCYHSVVKQAHVLNNLNQMVHILVMALLFLATQNFIFFLLNAFSKRVWQLYVICHVHVLFYYYLQLILIHC